ncbi:WD40 repeat domain-containing protein [Dactylosporangium siamense]|uniref:WD40 repeat domain-containing protein n=1 Tax=Dactylosporangium siamense TaxID=685454 RepID=A0A919PTW7_9ACTN|nr:hypothetical protein [Dactylosporangium siamense]GIG50119.1 hypothetical protein Dsi01nite_081600 [Dactylosporangium siamense]
MEQRRPHRGADLERRPGDRPGPGGAVSDRATDLTAVDVLDGLAVASDTQGTLHRLPLAGGTRPPVPGHHGEARTVACGQHPDGRAVAVTGGWDGTVRVWDLRAGAELHRIPVEHPVHAVALAADGTVVTGWQGGIGVFRLHDRRRRRR